MIPRPRHGVLDEYDDVVSQARVDWFQVVVAVIAYVAAVWIGVWLAFRWMSC